MDNCPYLVDKKIEHLTDLVKFNYGTTPDDERFSMCGDWIGRPLFTLSDGYLGYERIYYRVTRGNTHGKRYPKRTSIKASDNPCRFTPITKSATSPGGFARGIISAGVADGMILAELNPEDVVFAIQGESNVPQLAAQLRQYYPDMELIVATDNDPTGIRVAVESGCRWVVPELPGDDWSDLWARDGREAVESQFAKIEAAVPNIKVANLVPVDLPNRLPESLEILAAQKEFLDIASVAMAIGKKFAFEVGTRFKSGKEFVEMMRRHNPRFSRLMAENIAGLMDWIMNQARKDALTLVSIDRTVKARHNTRRIKEHELDGLPMTPGVNLLKGGHGVGKTERVGIPFIRASKANRMTLCHLASLAQEMSKRFDIELYSDVKEDARELGRNARLSSEEAAAHIDASAIAFCLPSINLTLKEWTKTTRIILIDEISQVLEFLALFKTRRFDNEEVFNHLKELVTNADMVLGLDADMNSETVTFLESCRPDEKFTIYELPNKSRAQTGFKTDWSYGEGSDMELVNRAVAALEDGKRIIIATDSNNKSKDIAAYLRSMTGKEVLCVNKDFKGRKNVAAFIRDPNVEASKYDCIVHSPTIRSGLSISEVDFDMGFGHFCGNQITPQDAIQMLRRARTVREWFLSVRNGSSGAIEDPTVYQDMRDIVSFDGTEPNSIRETLFDPFHDTHETRTNRAKNNFAPYLFHMLEHYGFTVRIVPTEDEPSALSELRKKRVEVYTEQVVNAAKIGEMEYEDLRRVQDKTVEQIAAMENFVIRRAFALDEIDGFVVDYWDEGRGLAKIRGLEQLTKPEGATLVDMTIDLTASLRSYSNTRARLIIDLLKLSSLNIDPEDIEISGGMLPDELEVMTDKVWMNRTTFAALRMCPASTARKSAKRPVDKKKFIKGVVSRFGLELMNDSQHRVEGKRIRTYVINREKMSLPLQIVKNRRVAKEIIA